MTTRENDSDSAGEQPAKDPRRLPDIITTLLVVVLVYRRVKHASPQALKPVARRSTGRAVGYRVVQTIVLGGLGAITTHSVTNDDRTATLIAIVIVVVTGLRRIPR
ncbi:hypothetical protein [Hamadaea tsunoensis]|uniref:hypothetical protein n=1 Tax=Hamadaea tsunoensis TaxID=53368 RepID=UPI000425AF09|nr:hypothetical protein [Hamadaea tsunoensis]